jgi:hypothetical protein
MTPSGVEQVTATGGSSDMNLRTRLRRGRTPRLLVAAGGALGLLLAGCGPTPPAPNADWQFRDYTSAAEPTAKPCAYAGGTSLTTIGSGTFDVRVESVDDFSEHVFLFSEGGGLELFPITGQAKHDSYSVAMLFRLSARRIGTFKRLIDVKHGSADSGLYLSSGRLTFFRSTVSNSFFGSKVIADDEYAQVVLTRAAGGTVTGYVDGVRQWQFSDTTGDALIDGAEELRFFRDNEGGNEHAAGAVARIRVFDRPLTATEVSNLGQTPGSPCAT